MIVLIVIVSTLSDCNKFDKTLENILTLMADGLPFSFNRYSHASENEV